jgi:5-methylcytosine-specific restriction endonuclease McrA
MTTYEVEQLKTQGTPRSPLWPAARAAWLKDHDTCRGCGTKDNLEVHHKKPFHVYPELELDPTNFITLCERPGHTCHFRIGHAYDWTKYNSEVEVDADHDLARVQAVHAPPATGASMPPVQGE